MSARPVIIDTDPGIDDAVAILLALAAPELAVEALVAVAGNGPLAVTERNARAICALAGRPDLPVYAGCPRPLRLDPIDAKYFHGETGLGPLRLPEPEISARPQHGVGFVVDRLRAAATDTVAWCALGPLTNVALALVEAPEIIAGVGEFVFMGGASRALGNTSAAAEFNILADPHAAAIVLDSGLPITMIPLDLTHQVRATAPRLARLRAVGTRCAAAVADVLAQTGAQPHALHDPCVIAYLLAPYLFAGSRVNVAIETHGPIAFGASVVDWRGVSGRDPNATVLHTVDADGVFALIEERLARLP